MLQIAGRARGRSSAGKQLGILKELKGVRKASQKSTSTSRRAPLDEAGRTGQGTTSEFLSLPLNDASCCLLLAVSQEVKDIHPRKAVFKLSTQNEEGVQSVPFCGSFLVVGGVVAFCNSRGCSVSELALVH